MKPIISVSLMAVALCALSDCAAAKSPDKATAAAAASAGAPALLENCTIHLVWKEQPSADTYIKLTTGDYQYSEGGNWVWQGERDMPRIGVAYEKLSNNKAELRITSPYFGTLGETITLTFTSPTGGTFTTTNTEDTPLKFYITR